MFSFIKDQGKFTVFRQIPAMLTDYQQAVCYVSA